MTTKAHLMPQSYICQNQEHLPTNSAGNQPRLDSRLRKNFWPSQTKLSAKLHQRFSTVINACQMLCTCVSLHDAHFLEHLPQTEVFMGSYSLLGPKLLNPPNDERREPEPNLKQSKQRHSCGTLLRTSLVGHSCGTLLYRTLLSDILVGHSCGTLLWDPPVWHSCRTRLWDTHARHSCVSPL